MGYRIFKKISDRQPQQDDILQFELLMLPKVNDMNWFSFKEQDRATGRCKISVEVFVFFHSVFYSTSRYEKK